MELVNNENNLNQPNTNISYATVLTNSLNSQPDENCNPSNTNINANRPDSKTSYTPDSLTDSFEDAEDSQLNFSSSTTPESKNDNISNGGETMSNDVEDSLPSTVHCDQEVPLNGNNSLAELSESNSEGDAELSNDGHYANAMKFKFRSRNHTLDLPNTVTVFDVKNGSKVYLVGTAHFSLESQEDVAKTICAVQPDVVMLELCKGRVNILSLDEATVLEEAKNMSFQKIKLAIEQNGFLQGILYFLLLSMSAHLTKQLGMAPGGEFRRAYIEAQQIPGCVVHLGDRPIHITFQRALAKLSLWQKLKIAKNMLSTTTISQEEVERCKQKDLLEEILAEMTGEFPELSEVFVKERDLYLTYSLQMAALSNIADHSDVPQPNCVVGVVGIGHVPGIVENWEKVDSDDVRQVLSIPKPTLTSKIISHTIRFSLYGAAIYFGYRMFPRSLIPRRLKFPWLSVPFGQKS